MRAVSWMAIESQMTSLVSRPLGRIESHRQRGRAYFLVSDSLGSAPPGVTVLPAGDPMRSERAPVLQTWGAA